MMNVQLSMTESRTLIQMIRIEKQKQKSLSLKIHNEGSSKWEIHGIQICNIMMKTSLQEVETRTVDIQRPMVG